MKNTVESQAQHCMRDRGDNNPCETHGLGDACLASDVVGADALAVPNETSAHESVALKQRPQKHATNTQKQYENLQASPTHTRMNSIVSTRWVSPANTQLATCALIENKCGIKTDMGADSQITAASHLSLALASGHRGRRCGTNAPRRNGEEAHATIFSFSAVKVVAEIASLSERI